MNCDEIEWVSSLRPSIDKDVSVVEQTLGITLPDDYKECAKKYGVGSPIPDVFDVRGRWGGEAVFNRLLTFDSADTYGYYIVDVWNNIKDRLIGDIYPFADDIFGNSICFDYREGKDKSPKVVFWDHEIAYDSPEDAILYICDSFTELISSLHLGE